MALAVAPAVAQLSPTLAHLYTSSHFAGTTGGVGFEDGDAGHARFNFPSGVAIDRAGNVYVADTDNHTIRKIRRDGVVTTLAGGLGGGISDGARSAAGFKLPYGVAVDDAGNVYVADSANRLVRKVTPYGAVSTLAGARGKSGSTDGTGDTARFSTLYGIAADGAGNVYVADTFNHTIRKIDPIGAVTTLAGLAGVAGSSDGAGSSARFKEPRGVAVDGDGNVYVAENNHTIRKINPDGVVSTLAGLAGVTGSSDGFGAAARFSYPWGVAVDRAGNVYVADTLNETIRKIDSAGMVSTIAGTPLAGGTADGARESARFSLPTGVAADDAGNVYVADTFNSAIRVIDPAGAVRTLAGRPAVRGSVDGVGSAARFNLPGAVAVDAAENVYVADTFNHIIRKITFDGDVSTFAGIAGGGGSGDGIGGSFYYPSGVATDASGNVYVADTGNHTIRKITSGGLVTTIAGRAGERGTTDGPASAARFNEPLGLTVDGAGNVYVADWRNHSIRKIDLGGMVTTVAGSSGSRGSNDGPSTVARFDSPSDVAVDLTGNLLVADSMNETIRKIAVDGTVTTFAGAAGSWGSNDGARAEARFSRPRSVEVDRYGYIWVADSENSTIRRIDALYVNALAGRAGERGSSDGIRAEARFHAPLSVAAGKSGTIYVADAQNQAIRRIAPIFNGGNIDLSSGRVGEKRQLGMLLSVGDEFEWTLIRRPANSRAELSSTTGSNPTFTPDAADFYLFRLTIRLGSQVNVNNIGLLVKPAPRPRPVRH